MRRLVKVVGGLVLAVVVLVVAAVIVVPLWLDPNDHKPQIEAAVKDATGRDLAIEGDIGVTVFPWLGIELGATELGNAPGFEPRAFARADKAVLRLKLLPLLRKQVELDTVVLHGLTLNLARKADGTTNWDDLAAGKKGQERPPARKETPGQLPVAGLALGGLDVRNGSIRWRDEAAGQRFVLSNLRAETGALTSNAPFDFTVSFDVQGEAQAAKAPVTGKVQMNGRLLPEVDAQRYALSGLELEAELAGEDLPGGSLRAALTGAARVDLAKATASLDDLRLEVGELAVTGSLGVEQLLTKPRYQGRLQVARFDPKALLKSLDLPPVETADADALRALEATLGVAGTPSALALDPVEVVLDQTRLSGNLKLVDLAKPAVRFELGVDAIDADRYLPPPGKEARPPPSPGAGGAAAAEIPVETLRGLDVAGTARVASLKISGLSLSDIEVALDAKGGLIRLSPAKAKLYEGSYAGNIVLDARGEVPKVSVDEKLAGVQAGPLLKDLQGTERLTGRADVTAALSAAGKDPEAMKRTAKGRIRFDFLEGAVKGLNVNQMLREAKAKLTGRSLPKEAGPNQTDFTSLGGTIEVADGVATNRDLAAKSPFLRVEGAGEANLVEETIDYRLKVVLVAESAGQTGLDLKELAGVPVPVRIRGTFAEPSYGLDVEALAGALAKSKVAEAASAKKEEVTEAVKEKAAEAVQEKLGGDAVKKLGGDKVEGAIKGLLGR